MISDMIAIIGHVDVDPTERDRLVAELAPVQASTERDEPGCLTYAITADAADPGRIRIVELWESAAALDAHFEHPNFRAAGAAMRSVERRGGSAMKYRIDASDPVRSPDGEVSSTFWSVDQG